jgi:hypothetical protein
MSATACTLAAVLVFEAAAASPATEECPLTDNRCKAGQYERRAATAPTPAQRALYLYGAYRSYMLLFDNTADRADLCAARRTLDASLAVAGQPPGQRATSRTKRAELAARERQDGADCKSVARRPRVKKTEAPLVARRPAPEPPAVAEPPADLEPPETTADLTHANSEPLATMPPARTAYLADLDGGLQTTVNPEPSADLMPVSARHVNTERPASAPRPGRGLVIAGGVTLGVGVALTAAAGFMGRRTVDTRQQIIALNNSVDGYATADQDARDDALRGDFRATQTRTLALAIGGGATVLVAVVLSSIGGRRMARAASRTALVPAPGGLVFHARF